MAAPYASNGSGGTPHLAAEWLKTMAGVKILHVPYKSNTNAVTDMLGARVDMMFLNLMKQERERWAELVRVSGAKEE